MENIFYYILLVFNAFIYGVCCFMILKRKYYTYFTIRSPPLLIINNFSAFLSSTIIILKQILNDKFQYLLTFFFYIFQFMMVLSFILRTHRFVMFNDIKNDQRKDIKIYTNNRYLYQELFYVKFLFLSIIIFTIILITLYFIFASFKNIITLNIEDYNLNNKLNKLNYYIWLFIIFFECGILMTYSLLKSIDRVHQKIQFELYSFTIIWFFFWNFNDWIYFKTFKNKNLISFIVSIIVFYLCLFINGFFIIFLTYSNNTNTAFTYNPQMMNNLYLFLINEECYIAFSNYLEKKFQNDLFYLKLYIQIIKYKLMFFTKNGNNNIIAKEIYNTYFSNDTYKEKILVEVYSSIREKSNTIDNPKEDFFDEGLKMCYCILQQRYIEFKKTLSFKELYNYFNLVSYIHCKMKNSGLINKY